MNKAMSSIQPSQLTSSARFVGLIVQRPTITGLFQDQAIAVNPLKATQHEYHCCSRDFATWYACCWREASKEVSNPCNSGSSDRLSTRDGIGASCARTARLYNRLVISTRACSASLMLLRTATSRRLLDNQSSCLLISRSTSAQRQRRKWP